MNENYLWNKTESDSEIEKLENALKSFRYTETDAPALPAKTLEFEPRRSRRFLRFAFAFAACLAFVVISLSVWFSVSNKNLKGGIETANVSLPQNSTVKDSPIVDKPEINVPVKTNFPAVKKSETAQHLIKTKFVQPRNFVSIKNQLNQTASKNDKPKGDEVKFTKEEKYAYDQLMLALAITSSKLKFVKDKADGLEKPDSAYSDGKYK